MRLVRLSVEDIGPSSRKGGFDSGHRRAALVVALWNAMLGDRLVVGFLALNQADQPFGSVPRFDPSSPNLHRDSRVSLRK